MPIKNYKPTSAGRRLASANAFAELTVSKPAKRLTVSLRRISGRNNQGKITVRHRGGAAKRRYRIIDFKQQQFDIPAVVKSIEYDPVRSAWIALLSYKNGSQAYVIASQDMKVGATVVSSKTRVDIAPGNR